MPTIHALGFLFLGGGGVRHQSLRCIAALLHSGGAAGTLSGMAEFHLSVQGRGTLALPTEIRRRHRLDEPGAQVRLVERDDGVIELHPLVAVPADQTWFWSERWQRMERDAEADVVAGRVVVTDGPDEFLDELDATA